MVRIGGAGHEKLPLLTPIPVPAAAAPAAAGAPAVPAAAAAAAAAAAGASSGQPAKLGCLSSELPLLIPPGCPNTRLPCRATLPCPLPVLILLLVRSKCLWSPLPPPAVNARGEPEGVRLPGPSHISRLAALLSRLCKGPGAKPMLRLASWCSVWEFTAAAPPPAPSWLLEAVFMDTDPAPMDAVFMDAFMELAAAAMLTSCEAVRSGTTAPDKPPTGAVTAAFPDWLRRKGPNRDAVRPPAAGGAVPPGIWPPSMGPKSSGRRPRTLRAISTRLGGFISPPLPLLGPGLLLCCRPRPGEPMRSPLPAPAAAAADATCLSGASCGECGWQVLLATSCKLCRRGGDAGSCCPRSSGLEMASVMKGEGSSPAAACCCCCCTWVLT